ncbi:MAG: D-arabinose 5-phosphate isomerase [Proteobacteria bacterium]|nr:MAG: D-arabinose 5-phosphate isomerase [Pseudomonadota bacterium]
MTELLQTQRDELIATAQQVITDEKNAIQSLNERLDDSFVGACQTILECKGRVIIAGMGKSGHIAKKIAATLASTGTPSFFVHPSEALHGDLGMITNQDVVISISNSGSTEELVTLCSIVRRQGTKIISMTGKLHSPLAKLADYHLDTGVEKEACPHDLAPTSSTTATLVMGDALAVSLLKARAFTPEDFARSHPAGRLGKRLSTHVSDLMHSGDDIPIVKIEDTLENAILTMTSKQLGGTLVVDADNKLISVFTDGDLRRAFEAGIDLKHSSLAEVTSDGCICISESSLAVDALTQMQKNKILLLPVVDYDDMPIGVLHMHDLLRAGIV